MALKHSRRGGRSTRDLEVNPLFSREPVTVPRYALPAGEMDPATAYSGLRMRLHRGNTIEEKDLPVVDHFAAEMEHMSTCVMENKQPLTPGEEGLRDLTIMKAIYEAANTGATVKL